MGKKNIIIICRNRGRTVDIGRNHLPGIMQYGSYIKQKYITKKMAYNADPEKIRAKIYSNMMMPEWIGNYRFSTFDLLNYLNNNYHYVYDPSADSKYFSPVDLFPTITSLHIIDYLIKKNYNPINMDNFAVCQNELKELLVKDNFAVVLSSTYFSSAYELAVIMKFIRKYNSNIPIIIGSLLLLSKLTDDRKLPKDYESLITHNTYMILDHGLTMLDVLLQKISNGGDLGSVNNIVYYKDQKVVYTETGIIEDDFDNAIPDWNNFKDIPMEIAFVRASQGCSSKCKFCTFPKTAVKFRHRSIESIREELKRIRDAGFKYLSYTDDHFAGSRARVTEICNMMIEEKFDFDWYAGIRTSTITEENAKLLKEAGCKVLCLGIESGDDSVLKKMNKGTTTSSNMKCLEILNKIDILTYGTFILGFPGESTETLKNTVNWINSSPLALYNVLLFHLLPGSIIYDEQEEHEISFWTDKTDLLLWKTPTLDGLKGSELLKQFILDVKISTPLLYHYSPMYAFFQFKVKGYSYEDSMKFFKLHTELIKNELSKKNWFSGNQYRKLKLKEIVSSLRNDL